MQYANCYNCESSNNITYGFENGFTLVKCKNCGLLYVNPRPSDEEIESAHKLGVHRGSKTLRVTDKFKKEKINDYLKILGDLINNQTNYYNKKWLDIGCGNGEFLFALQLFCDGQIISKGVEPNVTKQEIARGKGLDVSYFDLENHSDKYDVISLLNLYSHIPDPVSTLNNWKHLLNDHGELILQTGDSANLSYRDHYKPFSLPDHLSFASESIVVNILERLGFEILSVHKYPYVRRNNLTFFKEVVKLILPNMNSRLKYYLDVKKYTTDMFIHAKLK